MPDIIKVTPEELGSTAESFRTSGLLLHSIAMQMMDTVNGISPSVWTSEAAGSYLSKFKGLQADISKMDQMINKQSNHLRAVAENYKGMESQAHVAASSLRNNILS